MHEILLLLIFARFQVDIAIVLYKTPICTYNHIMFQNLARIQT